MMNSLTRKHVFRQQMINQKAAVCDKEQTELLAAATSTSSSNHNNNNEEKENKKSVTRIKSSGRRAVDTLETGRLAMHCSVVELNASDEDELLARSHPQERQQFGGCQKLLHRQQQQKHRSSVAIGGAGYEPGGNRAASKSSRHHQATWVGLERPTSGNSSSPAAQMSSRQQSAARQQQQSSRHAQSDSAACQAGGKQNRPNQPRSNVIDDLDRLLVRINLSRRSVSPSESSSSTLRAGSPLNRSGQQQQEFDYSTLCRDEFSNFIPFVAAASNEDSSSNANLNTDQNSNGFHHNNNNNNNTNHLQQQQQQEKQSRARTTKQASSKTRAKTKSQVASGGPMLVGVHSDEASSANHRRSIKPINHHNNNNHLLTNHHQYQATNYDDDNVSNDNRCHLNGGSLDSPEFPIEQLSSEGEIKSSSGCSMSHNGHSLDLNRYDDDDDDDEGSDDDAVDDRTPPPSGSCSPASKAACSSSGSGSNQSLLATPVSSSGSASSAVSILSSPVCLEENDELDNSGELFDLYVQRVRSLLRLTKGDKSVSMEEAFGCVGGQESSEPGEISSTEILVSAEHKTDIEFAPLERPNSARVVQELEMTGDFMCADDDESKKSRQTLTRATRVVEGEFASIISEPNTFPRLNWQPENAAHSDRDDSESEGELDERLKQLQRSLVNRLFLESKELLASQSSECDNRLVSTIISHTREFYQNYTIYQRELKARTSFANDWHKNWLFAFKRPNEESFRQSSQLGESPLQAPCFKRAKMSSAATTTRKEGEEQLPKSVGAGFPTTAHIDLIEYSTLLLNKHKPIKLNYRVRQATFEDSEMDQQLLETEGDVDFLDGCFSAIESCYAAQEEPKSEMYSNSLRSSRQMDVCRQLLQDYDDDDEDEDCENTDPKKERRLDDSKEQTIRKRGFLVNYKSSVICETNGSSTCCGRNRLLFSAYGYRFEIPLKRVSLLANPKSPKLDVLKHKVLTKFHEILNSPQGPQIPSKGADNQGEEAKFLVNLTNVELANELPVIQFCAKVSGALPIKVRWFNESNGMELGNTIYSTPSSTHRKSFNVRDCTYWAPSGSVGGGQRSSAWPLDLHAEYDYEYQTKWLSWYRFRRFRDEIMFEIRNASAELDYNQTYRCVIQNYCSARECSFRLTRRQVDDLLTDKKRRPSGEKRHHSSGANAAPAKAATAASTAALLRCWSERTLNKPQPSTTALLRENHNADHLNECVPANSAVFNFELEPTATTTGLSRRQQTVGWRSASFAAQAKVDDVEHKFGKDFPYHPENLLKRLAENKFSVRVNCSNKGSSASSSKSGLELPSPENGHSTRTRSGTDLAANLTTHRMQFADSSFDWPAAQTEHKKQQDQREQREQLESEFFGSEQTARGSNFTDQQLQSRLEDTTTTGRAYERYDCYQNDDGDDRETPRQSKQEHQQRLLVGGGGGGPIQQAGGSRTHQSNSSSSQLALDNNHCGDYDAFGAANTADVPKPKPRSKPSVTVIGATFANDQTDHRQIRAAVEGDRKVGASSSSWLRSSEQASVARFDSRRALPWNGRQHSDERQVEEPVLTPATEPVMATTTKIQAMFSNDNRKDVDAQGARLDDNNTVPSGELHSQSRPKPNNVKSLISRFSVKG